MRVLIIRSTASRMATYLNSAKNVDPTIMNLVIIYNIHVAICKTHPDSCHCYTSFCLIILHNHTSHKDRRTSLLKIGPVSHSRWLTTANRFCHIYVSKHGLSGKTLINLRLIVEYVVSVYYPCWFNIKVKYSWVEGPHHVLFQLQQLRLQGSGIVDVVLPTVKHSVWHAFSEMIIQTLLCQPSYVQTTDSQERRARIQKTIGLRAG